MASRPLAVFDLDGTLADVRHRLHFLDGRPRDWDSFFAAAPDDPPLADGVGLALASAGEHEIAYVTGRPERCRRDTLRWLARHGLPGGRLLMRGGRDRRPARVAKPELLRRLAEDRTVALVVDDDHQVCDAYEAAGFTVVRAGWTTAEPVLEQAQEAEGRT
jgi:phosphoglycolate phosphatase-like HAD superfamily hydrolase